MRYKVNDEIEITNEIALPIDPFRVYVLQRGAGAVIVGVENGAYLIRHRDKVLATTSFLLERNSELAKSPAKRYTKILETGLTYGQAVDKALYEGKKVAREIWGGYWQKQHIGNLSGQPSWTGEFLVAVLKDGGYAIATPYQEDMFAKDWMVVE